jgi:hypothetical protein
MNGRTVINGSIVYYFAFNCYRNMPNGYLPELIDIERMGFEAFPGDNHLEVAVVCAQQKVSEILDRRPEVDFIDYRVMELKDSNTISR